MIPLSVLFFATISSAQYISDQQYQPQIHLTPEQYLQIQTSQQLSPAPSHRPARPPPPPPPLPQQPPTRISQLLLPSTVDRQVQQAANNIAGPEYAQQVQSVQLQGLADQAQAVAQRRAQVAAQRIAQANRQAQSQYLLPQQQSQVQHVQQLQLQPQPQPQPQHQLQPAQSISPTYRYVNQPQRAPENAQPAEDYDPNPSYQFGFDVNDDVNTNYQNRKEQRNGEKITGSYSVVDADGFVRTVTYTADPKEGFKAEVNRQPTNIVVKFPKPAQTNLNQQYYQDPRETDPQNQIQQKYIYQQ